MLSDDSDYDEEEKTNGESDNRVVGLFRKLFQRQEQDMWLMLIERSMKEGEWNFNENEINRLLHTWDSDKNIFAD